eukprot:gb/GEZN01006173.1/.p1 GENE.gb/GEZN01006173.1/~~gb/GEZN01006173.1/.p1  ORF type:complete len:544 (+),score=64.16 gb/GEZN01006173.1/:38-1669(+)
MASRRNKRESATPPRSPSEVKDKKGRFNVLTVIKMLLATIVFLILILVLWPYLQPFLIPQHSPPAPAPNANRYFNVTVKPDDAENARRQRHVVKAMKWAWKGYKDYAWGKDMLRPVTKGSEQWFGIGLTLVDALDTLWLMNLTEEFKEAQAWVNTSLHFDKDVKVNLFETTIRMLGGLLSAYHFSGEEVFLNQAIDLADRLLVAFDTPSGIPLSDVHLLHKTAHAPEWTHLSSSSEVTTIQLEFKYLSHLTGDSKYKDAVEKVMATVFKNRPKDGLINIWIDPNTGKFSSQGGQDGVVTLGARGDSYYEYLFKQYVQTQRTQPQYFKEWKKSMLSVKKQLLQTSWPGGFVFIGERFPDHISPKMDHLVCFLAGTLALSSLEENAPSSHLTFAEDLAETCWETYKRTPTGLAGEITHFVRSQQESEAKDSAQDLYVKPADAHNLLRPETIESFCMLYRITGKQKYREWGWEMFKSFQKHTRIKSGGYSSLVSVLQVPAKYRDKMESFFLGETLKYFYLLFDDTNLVPLDTYVFNTEAHPLPIFS